MYSTSALSCCSSFSSLNLKSFVRCRISKNCRCLGIFSQSFQEFCFFVVPKVLFTKMSTVYQNVTNIMIFPPFLASSPEISHKSSKSPSSTMKPTSGTTDVRLHSRSLSRIFRKSLIDFRLFPDFRGISNF